MLKYNTTCYVYNILVIIIVNIVEFNNYFYCVHRAPRTNISLVPRALARKQTTPTMSASPSSQEITTEKKSNDDFRKLLYKQE